MALNRSPTAIQVNGAALLVKGDASGLSASYQRVPGLANFTLPDETGSTNETQLMDGSVSFAQIAGVGTITGSIGAVSGHPTHQWLAAKRRSGDAITVAIVRPAISVWGRSLRAGETAIYDPDTRIAKGTAADIVPVNTAAAVRETTVTIPNDGPFARAKGALREGMIFAAVKEATDGQAPAIPATYSSYGAAPPSTLNFQSIVAMSDDGKKFTISPGIANGGTKVDRTTTLGVTLYARRPGILYEDISCTVNGLGDGDFQSGSAVSSSLALAPSEALPEFTPEHRLLSEFGTAFNSVFADL